MFLPLAAIILKPFPWLSLMHFQAAANYSARRQLLTAHFGECTRSRPRRAWGPSCGAHPPWAQQPRGRKDSAAWLRQSGGLGHACCVPQGLCRVFLLPKKGRKIPFLRIFPKGEFSPESCKDALFTQSMHVWGGECVHTCVYMGVHTCVCVGGGGGGQ